MVEVYSLKEKDLQQTIINIIFQMILSAINTIRSLQPISIEHKRILLLFCIRTINHCESSYLNLLYGHTLQARMILRSAFETTVKAHYLRNYPEHKIILELESLYESYFHYKDLAAGLGPGGFFEEHNNTLNIEQDKIFMCLKGYEKDIKKINPSIEGEINRNTYKKDRILEKKSIKLREMVEKLYEKPEFSKETEKDAILGEDLKGFYWMYYNQGSRVVHADYLDITKSNYQDYNDTLESFFSLTTALFISALKVLEYENMIQFNPIEEYRPLYSQAKKLLKEYIPLLNT